jgi:hypothetical protein
MGESFVICRVQDATGRQFDYTFRVTNERSDGEITDNEFRMAAEQIRDQGLPPGLTFVGDSAVVREGFEEAGYFRRLVGNPSERQVLGVAQLFARAPAVITIPTVTIAGNPEIPTVNVEDLPLANPIPVVRVEDLPDARPARTGTRTIAPSYIDENGVPVYRFEDLPKA